MYAYVGCLLVVVVVLASLIPPTLTRPPTTVSLMTPPTFGDTILEREKKNELDVFGLPW